MKRKIILTVILAAVVVLIAFRLSSNKKKIDEKKNLAVQSDIIVPVKVETVAMADFSADLLKTGNIAPYKEVKALALNQSGTIQKLYINLGDHVRAGQVIASIDKRSQLLDLQKAEYHAHQLKSDVQTYTELLQGKAATKEKYNSVRQDYEDALNEVRQAHKSIADATIKAPAAGIISEKAVEEGMFVSSGAEIASIVDLSRTKVQVSLTETEVYQIAVGQQVGITADVYPGKEFHGKVNFISPQSDEMHSYMTEILMDAHEATLLRSGTFVYVHFSGKSMQNILAIPRESLTESVQNPYVYVVENNTVRLRQIKVNGEINGKIIVRSGLKPGETVVTSGQINLQDGTKVKISK